MSIQSRITQTLARARDSDSNDTALAYREVHYTDSSGNRTGKIGHHCRLYNATGGVLTLNAVYMVNYSGNPATSPQVIASATSTPTRELVIAKEAVAIGAWGWFCFAGWTDALVEGTTDVAVGDFLKLTSGTTATAFIKDGTTITTSSHAIAGAASTANSENTTLIDPNDPLDGGYGMCLSVETTEIEPGVRELSTVFLTRQQLQENDWEWVRAEIKKQCEKIVSLTPKRDDYPAQFQRLEQRAEAIWRKLNGVEREQAG